ncbi:MAG: citrate lyase holo-[acyl-carrier protein] synthase, partial [Clostridia bacterium]|nr:citrate lyase holo-[acyl-carrier protein] synthase [Clostridia bacterium]
MPVTVQDMMEARDRRAEKQRELLAGYGQTLLCFTMNIPGPEKVNSLIRQGFALGQRRLEQGFMRLGITPLYRESFAAPAGCEAYYVLPLPPLEAKKLAVDIEEADALGRLFDMDVLRPDGSK